LWASGLVVTAVNNQSLMMKIGELLNGHDSFTKLKRTVAYHWFSEKRKTIV
jgi:hypothetical protein